ncbi:MAG: hypothetical protein QNI84_06620 [Henriciella sp.]|nr:hypothetical protein [Henriciella sp.]
MMKSVLGALSAVLLVTACASSPETREGSRNASAVDTVSRVGLSAQSLEPGECGLFLWSKTDTNRFAFFSKALSGTAVFKPAEEELRLTQSRSRGTIFGQFTTDMGYTASDGSEVALTFQPGETLNGGQRVEAGLITVTDPDGWQTKLPILGVRACQPE